MAQTLILKEERLTRLAEKLRGILAVKRDVDEKTWKLAGEVLLEARDLFPGDREFGQWIKSQEFAEPQPTLNRWTHAYHFAHTPGYGQIACDDVHALAQLDQFNSRQIQEIASEAKEQGIDAITRRNLKPLLIDLGFREPPPPPVVWSENEKIRGQLKELDRRMEVARDAQKKANDSRRRYEALTAKHQPLLTLDEFKLVRSCLHPDRDVSKEKLNKAFALFNKLEILFNKQAALPKPKGMRR